MSTQSLGIVDRLMPEVRSGAKTSTIRWNERRVQPGPLRFVNDKDPCDVATVNVTRCTDLPLSATAEFVGRLDEWPDDVLLDGMREHYPDIELDSVVQVVEFRLADTRTEER